ncbi:MAG: hypothetical protein E5Y69_37215, partial [Mesorhizobium sp.]
RDAETGALLAQNPYGLDFSERVAFLAADSAAHSVTADRGEFIGRHGTSELPHAVLNGASLSGRVEAGDDPCAA